MATQDSIYLLRECDAGAKMAMASLDDVKDRTRNTEMQKILLESRQQHELIAEQIHKLLDSIGTGEKDPSPMARGMSAVKPASKWGWTTATRPWPISLPTAAAWASNLCTGISTNILLPKPSPVPFAVC